jgi:hypothetical protein
MEMRDIALLCERSGNARCWFGSTPGEASPQSGADEVTGMTAESCPEDHSRDGAAPVRNKQTLVISHGEMNDAYLSGRAVPLAQSVSWLVRYQGCWWVVYERGWLRVTDDLVEADIDTCASLLTDAVGNTAREVHICAAGSPPDPGEPGK